MLVRVSLAVLLSTLTGLVAQEREFRTALEALHRRAQQGATREAFDGLQRLLEAHEGRDYARRARFEIETLHRRCSFRLRTSVPEPKDVVSGELLAWDAPSGNVKLRYPADRLDDWRREGGTTTLDARFVGPHSIELRGNKYAPEDGAPGEGARVHVLREEGSAVKLLAGLANVRGPALVREQGLQRTPLVSAERSPLESGKPFRIQVRVGETFVRVFANGQLVLDAKKTAQQWGRVAFGGVAVDEVVLEGKVEPAWIQQRLDTAFHDALRRFERHYDPHKELPIWLWMRQPRVGSDQAVGEAWPDRLDEAQQRIVQDAERLAAQREFETSLRLLRGHPRMSLPEATSTALELGLLTSLEHYEEAGKAAEALATLAPEAPLTKILRAELDLALGRGAESIRSLSSLMDQLPSWERLHVDLALARMTEGDLEAAKRGVDLALKLGVDGPDLASVNRTLVKALAGPDWTSRSTFTSSHFEVLSNIDATTCKRVADLLEGNHTLLQRQLGAAPGGGRAKVLLFAGPDGFHRFVEELWGARLCPNVCGYYHPLLKQMLVSNDSREGELLATVRHEGLHLFLDRVAPQTPLWLNEGLACYYERKIVSGTSFVDGPSDPRRLAFLKEHPLIPLAELLARSPETFYGDAEQSYAQAFAFVVLLLDTKPEHKKRFQGYWKALLAGALPEAAQRMAFPTEVLTALDRELAELVPTLR